MANKKFTDLDPAGANPTLVDSDIMAVTLDPGGTPVSRKTSISNLMGKVPVQSVAGRTGAVVLDADDIDDTLTTNKFVTSTDITNLSNLSGTNSGDVTLATVPNNYLSLSGQEITAGVVPVSLGGTGSGDLATARANLGLGTAATTDASDYATAAHTHAIDDLSDVDTSTVAPTNDDLLKWDGSNFVPGTVTVDVDTPLNTALRGTDNPHMGAYPNQSFKVIDNPKKVVMVVATDSGDLDFLLPDGGSIYLNTPTGGRLAPGFGFSVTEDATEPDIEVASGGETYSVISGDSDSKGANGLPIRQGFNLPDIGAFPAPILISGGSIA